MTHLKTYLPELQSDIEVFYAWCFPALGWGYEPHGRHADIVHINDIYMSGGMFWCLYDGEALAGTVAVRCLDDEGIVGEMKRLYLLPAYQGKGYGTLLFRTALDFAKTSGFKTIRLDTRLDRAASRHLIEKHRFRRIDQYNQNALAELFYELDLIEYDLGE